MNTHYLSTLDSLNIYARKLHIYGRAQYAFYCFVLFFIVTKVNQKDIDGIQFTKRKRFKRLFGKCWWKSVHMLQLLLFATNLHSHTHTHQSSFEMNRAEKVSINCILNRKSFTSKLLACPVSNYSAVMEKYQRKHISKDTQTRQTDRHTSNSAKKLLCCRLYRCRCCTCISPFSHIAATAQSNCTKIHSRVCTIK